MKQENTDVQYSKPYWPVLFITSLLIYGIVGIRAWNVEGA